MALMISMVALSIAVVEGVARQLAPELRLMQEALPLLSRLAAAQGSQGESPGAP